MSPVTRAEERRGCPVVHRFSGPQEAVAAAADRILELTSGRGEMVLGWPTGRTMIPLYDALARWAPEERQKLQRHRGFNLDELLLPAQHPASFAAYMERHAFAPGLLLPSRCDIPRVEGDPLVECARYEAALQQVGGLDLAILGIGEDGHVAYNLPGPAEAVTHLVELPDRIADTLPGPEFPRPLRAITLGLGAFQQAERLLLLATGTAKATAVQQLVEGPRSTDWPATLLRSHPRFEVYVDAAAASQIAPDARAEPRG